MKKNPFILIGKEEGIQVPGQQITPKDSTHVRSTDWFILIALNKRRTRQSRLYHFNKASQKQDSIFYMRKSETFIKELS